LRHYTLLEDRLHRLLSCDRAPPPLHSFPTRRSSDLSTGKPARGPVDIIDSKPFSIAGKNSFGTLPPTTVEVNLKPEFCSPGRMRDRKSTRLNSSHVKNSYAVFCLKKKNHKQQTTPM